MMIIDVRERDEFKMEHIPESIFCPLSEFDFVAPGIVKFIGNNEVTVICRSGKRAEMAIEEFKNLGVDTSKFSSYSGGLNQWISDGKKVLGKSKGIPIMRQMQIAASMLIFIAFLGSYFVHPNFVYLALFVGFGLSLAGFSGICPMVFFLQKMPWNKNKSTNCSARNINNCCD